MSPGKFSFLRCVPRPLPRSSSYIAAPAALRTRPPLGGGRPRDIRADRISRSSDRSRSWRMERPFAPPDI